MLAEYLKYWGLQKPPFSLTPDPEMLYMSRQHQEALIRLKYAVVSNKGGALLVSENAGDGKTSLLAKLRQELEGRYQDRCRTVFIDHPTLTANQMVGEIVRQLGLPVQTNDKLALLNELRPFLLERHRQGEQCVVILDEGQMLCHRPDLLQELRILLNFCVSDSFLLTFILSGQKPLDEAIRAMPEFYQRLPVRFFLRNLSRDETRELIRHRLRVAGADPRQGNFQRGWLHRPLQLLPGLPAGDLLGGGPGAGDRPYPLLALRGFCLGLPGLLGHVPHRGRLPLLLLS